MSMKVTYRIFSTHTYFVIIAICFIVVALVTIGWGILMLFNGNYFQTAVDVIFYLSALSVVLLANTWFLTSSVLPLVKVNKEGITAYSLFWTRCISWENVQILRLVKVKNQFHIKGARVWFEDCKAPETKSIAVLNKGIRVATYIIVSNTSWHKPHSTHITNFYHHHTIAGKQAIAFQYDRQAWKTINELAGRKTTTEYEN